MHFFEVWSWCGFLSVVSRSSLGGIGEGIREGNLKKEHFTGQHTKHHTLGGRAYPVRHYPIAIRLRDRKGRAILCSHYFLSVGTLRVLHSECVPSHSFTVVSRLSVGGIGQDIREVKELAILIKVLF